MLGWGVIAKPREDSTPRPLPRALPMPDFCETLPLKDSSETWPRMGRSWCSILVRRTRSMAARVSADSFKSLLNSIRRWKKDDRTCSVWDSKNVVADHQCRAKARFAWQLLLSGAAPIVRQSSCCMPSGIRRNRPYPCPVLYFTSRRFHCCGYWLMKRTGCFLIRILRPVSSADWAELLSC